MCVCKYIKKRKFCSNLQKVSFQGSADIFVCSAIRLAHKNRIPILYPSCRSTVFDGTAKRKTIVKDRIERRKEQEKKRNTPNPTKECHFILNA